jgi:hypothetical protein
MFRALTRLALTALCAAAAACSDSGPGPTPTPQQPPVVPAPVITSVTATTARVEAGQEVAVSAVVQDGNPSASTMTYQWSANVGTVTGTGLNAIWKLDPGAISSGADVVITLTVVKPYQVIENNQLVSREHRVSLAAAPFRAHDSTAEISRIVLTFLVDYFGNFNVSPDACLVDFSPTCPGTAEEFENIRDNRERSTLRIHSAEASIGKVELNGDRTFAWIDAPCRFTDVKLASGEKEWTSGTCVLTATYQQNRWWLCSSNYNANAGGSSPARAAGARRGGLRYWE